VTATSTLFTAPPSQIQAERAGFETVLSQNYSEVLDEYGKPLFPDIHAKEFKIMIKKLQ
jgi:ABC-type transporter MlaC component